MEEQESKTIVYVDALHGEVEAFNARGRHLGSFDPVTATLIKPPVQGRKIDV